MKAIIEPMLRNLIRYGEEQRPEAAESQITEILRILPQPIESQEAVPLILKGVGKINGDGWKDTTEIGQVVYVWNFELPEPYGKGQFRRIGYSHWSASTRQYDFEPVLMLDVQAVIEQVIESERDKLRATHQPHAKATSGDQPATQAVVPLHRRPEIVEPIARAFWRRIAIYASEFPERELPKPLPVQFAAHMATALSWLDTERGRELLTTAATPEQVDWALAGIIEEKEL